MASSLCRSRWPRTHAKHFRRKIDAQQWLDTETAKLVTGTWVDPGSAKITVAEWCQTWLAGYGTRKPRTVRQAEVHIAKITEAVRRPPTGLDPAERGQELDC